MKSNMLIDMRGLLESIKFCIKISLQSSRTYTLLRIFIKLITPLISLISLYFSKEIINILANIGDQNKLVLIIFLIFLFNILIIVSNRLSEYFSMIHDDLIDAYLSQKILDRTFNSDVELFDNPDQYNKLNFATQNQLSICQIIWQLFDLMSAFTTMIVTLLTLFNVSEYYLIILVVSIFPTIIMDLKYTRIMYNLTKEQVKDERRRYYIYDLSCSKEYSLDIRMFGFKDVLKEKYTRIWMELHTDRKKILNKKVILTICFECLPEIIISLLSLDLIYKILNGGLTIGDYSLYMGMIIQFNSAMFLLINNMISIYDNKIKIDSIKEFFSIPIKIENSEGLKLELIKNIVFQNVYFKYPNTDNYVLKNICLEIKEKDKLAIIGSNGSGKSTLIKLLLRFYDVTEGKILINNRNISEYNIHDLRKCFTSYLQDAPNYSFTIRENIALSDWEKRSDTDRIVNTISSVNGHDILNKISDIDDSYTKLFTEEGIELSKGQGQKMALARSFFRKTDVFILDEPSSSLDVFSEYEIFSKVKDDYRDKIIIFISHSMSNVSNTDKIIVLDHGEIVESGTKDMLLKSEGIFTNMYNFQKNKYK